MDNLVLYSADGASPINLGSFLQAAGPYDIGDTNLYSPLLAQGAQYAGRGYGVKANLREWTLPLLLPSNSAWGGLRQLETMIRSHLSRRSYLDFQTFGVASAEAVRFDVEAGYLAVDHDVRISELARQKTLLKLWTQPYGYWPTLIQIFSAGAGSQIHGNVPWTTFIPAASIIGDGVIPFVVKFQTNLLPTVASVANQSRVQNRVLYSIHSYASVPSFFNSLQGNPSWSYLGNLVSVPLPLASVANPSFGPVIGAQASTWVNYVSGSNLAAGFGNVSPTAMYPVAAVYLASTAGSTNSYLGRFRMFGFARALGASSFGWLLSGQLGVEGEANLAMPTARQQMTYATLPHPSVGNLFAAGGSAWSVLDFGEVQWPPAGTPSAALAGGVTPVAIIWGRPLASVASWGTVASFGPSQGIEIAGVSLVPVASNGAFGILSTPAGMGSWPNAPEQLSPANLDSVTRTVGDGTRSLVAFLNGDLPAWDRRNAQASGVAFTFFPYTYHATARQMYQTVSPVDYSTITISYRPTFSFLRAL